MDDLPVIHLCLFTLPTSLHTLSGPIIYHNTRIIGICGIPKAHANPRLDGWFFSDFFAFNYLLKGLGSSQTWFATTTASELVETYGEFLHGNPCRDRKIVLSKDLLDRGEITKVTVVPEDGFLHAAMEALQTEFRLARETGSPILLLLFCHGDEETKGVFLGDKTMLQIEDVRRMIGAMHNDDVALTVISTACFSGGWSVCVSLNATTSTAAGPDNNESESWTRSKSVRSRLCGSIYHMHQH